MGWEWKKSGDGGKGIPRGSAAACKMTIWEEGSVPVLPGWDHCIDHWRISRVRAGFAGVEGSSPSPCRVEQLYQKVMALWHQLHMNTKSLISWNYLRKDIALVQSFSMEKVQRSFPACCWACAALQASLCAQREGKTRVQDWGSQGAVQEKVRVTAVGSSRGKETIYTLKPEFEFTHSKCEFEFTP